MQLRNDRILNKILIAFMLFSYARWLPAVEYAAILLPDGTQLNAEIASTSSERERGLMYRTELPTDGAMLFAYADSDQRAIWMKNTLISLDVLFLSEQGTIVDMKHSLPPCMEIPCPIYRSSTAARYILEINAGSAKRTGLKLGDELLIDYQHEAGRLTQDH